jgi:hypothetical protein
LTDTELPTRIHYDDQPFVAKRLATLPAAIQSAMVARYDRVVANTHNGQHRRAANTELRRVTDELLTGAPWLSADDDAIERRARTAAERCAYNAARSRRRGSDEYAAAAAVCARYGIETPAVDEERGKTRAGALARMQCRRWWRRRLCTEHGRAVERACIRLDMVGPGRQRGRYVGPYAATRWKQNQAKLRRMIDEARAVCTDTGEEMSLAPIIGASLANPEVRRAELMTRLRGFEETAQVRGDRAEFVTITCPSRLHATSRGDRNPRYDGSTPRDAQAYLRDVWARIRAAWSRRGIRPYGMRVAEPHTDGCPHWHVILFIPESQADEAVGIAHRYALADTPDEPGAAEYRFKRKTIDSAKGTACGYVAKYVAKSIDGYSVGEARDLFGGLTGDAAESAAQRIRAWASTWGIRQFQQVGGPPVTVWREARRIHATGRQDSEFEQVRRAADAGDWAAFIEAMGGVDCAADARPVQTWRRKSTLVHERDGYGDPAPPKLRGLRAGPILMPTRASAWRVEWQAKRQGAESRAREAADVEVITKGGGEAADPWTRGNNCTRGNNERSGDCRANHPSPPNRQAPQRADEGAGGRIGAVEA